MTDIPDYNIIVNFKQPTQNFLDFKLMKENQLREFVFSISNLSSTDNIDVEFHKLTFKNMYPPFLNILNNTIETGIVPRKLKNTTLVIMQNIIHALEQLID